MIDSFALTHDDEPDSVELTALSEYAIRFHKSVNNNFGPLIPSEICQDVQQVETVIAEGGVSHGQNENFSDSEDYFTPPSSPAPIVSL